LRLRQRLGFSPFSAANFNFGLFDMTLTPSARAFGDERIFLRTVDMSASLRSRFAQSPELSLLDKGVFDD
jgi:hypothetical protein